MDKQTLETQLLRGTVILSPKFSSTENFNKLAHCHFEPLEVFVVFEAQTLLGFGISARI